jgi:DUF1365 family protein
MTNSTNENEMNKFNAEEYIQNVNELTKKIKNYSENCVDWNNFSDEDIRVLNSAEKLRDILVEFETKLDEVRENGEEDV